MKFLRTVRFDDSDKYVFTKAAEPGSWAIPGGFMFSHLESGDLTGKERQAFRNGFLSIEDSAWSTFVSVGELTAERFDQLNRKLATFLLEEFNAPDENLATAAASAELAFAADICAQVSINTVFSLHREYDEQGNVKEAFRIVEAGQGNNDIKAWEFIEEQ
jgi:uncharacterized protein DUF6505